MSASATGKETLTRWLSSVPSSVLCSTSSLRVIIGSMNPTSSASSMSGWLQRQDSLEPGVRKEHRLFHRKLRTSASPLFSPACVDQPRLIQVRLAFLVATASRKNSRTITSTATTGNHFARTAKIVSGACAPSGNLHHRARAVVVGPPDRQPRFGGACRGARIGCIPAHAGSVSAYVRGRRARRARLFRRRFTHVS